MEDQDKLIDYKKYSSLEETKKNNFDSILTEEEKEIFKKAGMIGKEFLNNYELAKQKQLLEEEDSIQRRI